MLLSIRCMLTSAVAVGFLVACGTSIAAPPDGKGPNKTPGSKLNSGPGKSLGAKKSNSPQAGGGKLGQNPQSSAGKGGRDFVRTPQGWFRRGQRREAEEARVAQRPDKMKGPKDKLDKASDKFQDKLDKAHKHDHHHHNHPHHLHHPGKRAEAHAKVLQKRLAQIDKMRDRAIETGNEKLLETADKLEQQARNWAEHHADHFDPDFDVDGAFPTDGAGTEPTPATAAGTTEPAIDGPALTPLP
jgi:hypothetical protein